MERHPYSQPDFRTPNRPSSTRLLSFASSPGRRDMPSSPLRHFSSDFDCFPASEDFLDDDDDAISARPNNNSHHWIDGPSRNSQCMRPLRFLLASEMTGRGVVNRKRIEPTNRMVVDNFVSTEADVSTTEIGGTRHGNPPFTCSYAHSANGGKLVAVAEESGDIQILDTSTSKPPQESIRGRWNAHSNAVFDLSWSKDDQQMISVSGDQVATLWDVETKTALCTFEGHASSIKTASIHPDDPNIFATGARDGVIMIWDRRCTGVRYTEHDYMHKPADIIRNAHLPQTQHTRKRRRTLTPGSKALSVSHSVTSVVFLKNQPTQLASVGAADSVIKIWDLRYNGINIGKQNPTPAMTSEAPSHLKRPRGHVHMSLDSTGTRLFAACTDDTVYMYSAHSISYPLRAFSAHGYKSSSFYVRVAVSPDDKWLLSGSSDNNAYLWEIEAPNRNPIVLSGHRGEVSGVNWCRTEFSQIATCSDDQTIRIWNADAETKKTVEADPSRRDLCGMAREGRPSTKKISLGAPCRLRQSSLFNAPNLGTVCENSSYNKNSPQTKRPSFITSKIFMPSSGGIMSPPSSNAAVMGSSRRPMRTLHAWFSSSPVKKSD